MSEFESTEWSRAESCRQYQESADHYVVERQTLLQILRLFYQKFLGVGRGNRVLDLGCGDGVLGATLSAIDRSIRLIEADGSPEMLRAARQRLSGCSNVEYCPKTFQALLGEVSPWTGLDLVVSAFAVHHLEHDEKAALFRKIRGMLREGGWFINIDVLVPRHRVYQEWYLDLWREWIVERQQKLGLPQDYSQVPAEACAKPENKYEDLEFQLEALRQAGFAEEECFYRYGLFGIYGARKPQVRPEWQLVKAQNSLGQLVPANG